MYACFASSLSVTAAAPTVKTPPAITSLLRLLLFGPDLPFDPPAPPAALAGALAFVSTALTIELFTALLAVFTVVANPLPPCNLLATKLRCVTARVHARHVHALRRSSGEKEYTADIIAW